MSDNLGCDNCSKIYVRRGQYNYYRQSLDTNYEEDNTLSNLFYDLYSVEIPKSQTFSGLCNQCSTLLCSCGKKKKSFEKLRHEKSFISSIIQGKSGRRNANLLVRN